MHLFKLVIFHLGVFLGFSFFSPECALAQRSGRIVATEVWVEQWNPAEGRWIRVETHGGDTRSRTPVEKVSTAPRPISRAKTLPAVPFPHLIAARLNDDKTPAYGPFIVLDDRRAALVGTTGARAPAQFQAMLRDFPDLEVIDFIDGRGTRNDVANLAVGRRIRAAGLATRVPASGSARSGAVELFLAGATRIIEPGANFAVHSWLDESGREPHHYGPNAPAHRMYVDYYVEMGMEETVARAFYAMTNSVSHSSAKWLRAHDMHNWIAPNTPLAQLQPNAAALPKHKRDKVPQSGCKR